MPPYFASAASHNLLVLFKHALSARVGNAIKQSACAGVCLICQASSFVIVGSWLLKITSESRDLIHSIPAHGFACAAANAGPSSCSQSAQMLSS